MSRVEHDQNLERRILESDALADAEEKGLFPLTAEEREVAWQAAESWEGLSQLEADADATTAEEMRHTAMLVRALRFAAREPSAEERLAKHALALLREHAAKASEPIPYPIDLNARELLAEVERRAKAEAER